MKLDQKLTEKDHQNFFTTFTFTVFSFFQFLDLI